MTCEKIEFESTDQYHMIQALIYEPETKPKAILQIVHGMNEYKERYEPFCRFMTENGFIVGIDDHLGHGESIYSKDERGNFGDQGVRNLVEDEHRFYLELKKRYPDLPYFLLGHSMGSFITRAYLSTFDDELDGYICMGSKGSDPAVKPGIALAKIIAGIKGKNYHSALLENLSQSGFNKKFEDEADPTSWLSRNVENRHAFAQDERADFSFTAQGYATLLSLIDVITGRRWASRVNRELPILIVSGAMDPVGEYGKGPREIRNWLKAEGVKDVSLIIYPEARHELLNELNREEVEKDLLNWMNSIIRQEQEVKPDR